MQHLSMNSPLGPLTIFEDGDALVALEWGRAPKGNSSPLLVEARSQLDAYFARQAPSFDLPLDPGGTAFQRSVWRCMVEIPLGATRTYGEIAGDLASAPRAVGGASGRNPIPILIPCHRVVGAGGRLTGYSGHEGVATKRTLLRLEGCAIDLFDT